MEPIKALAKKANRSSSSSTRSVHSTHSAATLKARSPSAIDSTVNSVNPLAYAVGAVVGYNDEDTDMTDTTYMYMHQHQHQHQHFSRSVPIPPARSTSLSQQPNQHQHGSSSSDLPSVHVTVATPTKKRSSKKANIGDESITINQPQFHNSLGHGSLDLSAVSAGSGSFEPIHTFAGYQHVAGSAGQPDIFSIPTEEVGSDTDIDAERSAEEKKAKIRQQGRLRQARKRERDKAEKERAKSNLASSHPYANPSAAISFSSRNASTSSLAPISIPLMPGNTPSLGPSSSSPIYSSLHASDSFPSLSPNASSYSIASQQASGTSSPATNLFSPTPLTSNSGYGSSKDGYSWTSTKQRASRSAVDVSIGPYLSMAPYPPSSASTSTTSLGMAVHQVVPIALEPAQSIAQAQTYPSKRRRSEPEPKPVLIKEVGLGVVDIAEENPIDYSATPGSNKGASSSRPVIRRTASDSAATALAMPTAQPGSRSPTPPLLETLQDDYNDANKNTSGDSQATTSAFSSNGSLFASAVKEALATSTSENVKSTLARLNLTDIDLQVIMPELAALFDRFRLTKDMKAVSLDDTGAYTNSAYTSMKSTPYHESIPLSAVSTRMSSPNTSNADLFSIGSERAKTSHATTASFSTAPGRPVPPQITPINASTKTPSRARSLSSASMRARGLKMSSSSMTRSPVPLVYQQDPLVSPLSSTTFHFPNSPSIPAMPESDGASPLHSSLQTPSTGQGSFPHHEIMAMAAGGPRPTTSQSSGGGGGLHQRSATDPAGSKVYTRQHWGSQDGFTMQQDDQQFRPQHSHHRTQSALQGAFDMSYGGSMGMSAMPPPHMYQSSATSSPVQPYQAAFATPTTQRTRPHHAHSGSISTPFTPTPAHVHRPSHPVVGMYQPAFTPIAEMGTPTRQQLDTSMMGARQGDLDQMMLSPSSIQAQHTWNPQSFAPQPQSQDFAMDPFNSR